MKQKIEVVLAPAREDPIQRLEHLIASAKREGDRTEVMEGLKRLLESPGRQKRRKPRTGVKR